MQFSVVPQHMILWGNVVNYPKIPTALPYLEIDFRSKKFMGPRAPKHAPTASRVSIWKAKPPLFFHDTFNFSLKQSPRWGSCVNWRTLRKSHLSRVIPDPLTRTWIILSMIQQSNSSSYKIMGIQTPILAVAVRCFIYTLSNLRAGEYTASKFKWPNIVRNIILNSS